MTNAQRPQRRWLRFGRTSWLLLALAAAGCADQDAERMSRIGRILAGKADVLTVGANKLAAGWQAMRGDLDDAALDARVSSRLRWDKALAGAAVQVHADGSTISLEGSVTDAAQRHRAVELAESTAGVDKVNDQLRLPDQGSPAVPSR